MPQKQPDHLAVVVSLQGRRHRFCRQSFERDLDRRLAIARSAGQGLSVTCLRIDGDDQSTRQGNWEELNERLAWLHDELQMVIRSADQVGWPWQSGLAIVESGTGDPITLHRRAEELMWNVHRLLRRRPPGHGCRLRLGIALYPDDGTTSKALLESACDAAKRAEGWGRAGFCFSSRSTARQVADRLSMDVALRQAFETGSVGVDSLPILDLRRSRIAGMTLDPSWRHPERGRQTIDDFLEVIERADLAAPCNDWLVDQLSRLSGLSRASRNGAQKRVSFMAVRSQLADGGLASRLASVLETAGLSADLVEIVIDSRHLVDRSDHRLRTALGQLSDLGVRLAAANVGMEMLPIEALTVLPLNAVAFAPMAVSTIGRCPSSERSLEALISYMNALDRRTRATGVASEEQIDFLSRGGCHEASGPLLAVRRPGRRSSIGHRLSKPGRQGRIESRL